MISSVSPASQGHHLSQGSRKRGRDRRSPADRTRRVQPKPGVHTLDMEEVATIRKLPQHIRGLVIGQTYRTTWGCGVSLLKLGLGVRQLWIALDGCLIESHIDYKVRHVGRLRGGVSMRLVGCGGRRRERRAGAEVGGEGDACDEEEDPNGDSNAVAKSAYVIRAKQASGVICVVHDLIPKKKKKNTLFYGKAKEEQKGLGLGFGVRRMAWGWRAIWKWGQQNEVWLSGGFKYFRKSTLTWEREKIREKKRDYWVEF